MCIKYVDVVTYNDGRQEVTQRVSTCRSGHMCSRPEIVQRTRPAPYSRLTLPLSPRTGSPLSSSSAERRTTNPYAEVHLNLPPTPRKSPSPSGSDSSARRRARQATSTILVGGAVVEMASSKPKRRHHHGDDAPPSPRVIVEAPEPPSPLRGRPLRRSSTMPTSSPAYVVVDDSPHRHIRRSAAAEAATAAAAPHLFGIDIDAGRRATRRTPAVKTPEPVFVDEERHRADRRRRAERRASTGLGIGLGLHDFPSNMPAASSAAAEAVRKELRWKDEVEAKIAHQNAHIAARDRPKATLHQEVRGILKNGNKTTAPKVDRVVPEVVVTPSATSERERQRETYDALRRAVGNMDIPRRFETAAQRALRDERRRTRERDHEREAVEEEQYYDRLRGRFDSGEERKRRSRVYYPGEGLYKYL